jgi:chemotaxis protein CheC
MEALTELRQAALQEIINISFGRASASLAELLNAYVALNVPHVQEIAQSQVFEVLEQRVGIDKDVTVVQQSFTGDFEGEVLLAVPANAGMRAIKILGQGSRFAPDLPVTELEMEVFLEIGNIVIGACMGQFAELLNTSLSYEVPDILLTKSSIADLRRDESNNGVKTLALLIKTDFQLGEEALSGFLFILFGQQWFNMVYLALDKFIEDMT